MLTEPELIDLLKLKGEYLFHRESQTLEFKEQFNWAALADYLKNFAAFANNKGGILLFGVKDSPREPIGLSDKSSEMFESLKIEEFTGHILECFSKNITWTSNVFQAHGKKSACFQIEECNEKPVIAKKDAGIGPVICNGDVFFRYGGRTQKIMASELESIILNRIRDENKAWIDHVKSIGPEGPKKSIILKTESDISEISSSSFVIDSDLANKIKFIREGQFDEKNGATALKLVGDLIPVGTVEVEKIKHMNALRDFPYSFSEMVTEIKKRNPKIKSGDITKIISENNLKTIEEYSYLNFRSKKIRDEYEKTGLFNKNTTSIYNEKAIEFILSQFD